MSLIQSTSPRTRSLTRLMAPDTAFATAPHALDVADLMAFHAPLIHEPLTAATAPLDHRLDAVPVADHHHHHDAHRAGQDPDDQRPVRLQPVEHVFAGGQHPLESGVHDRPELVAGLVGDDERGHQRGDGDHHQPDRGSPAARRSAPTAPRSTLSVAAAAILRRGRPGQRGDLDHPDDRRQRGQHPDHDQHRGLVLAAGLSAGWSAAGRARPRSCRPGWRTVP